MPSGCRTDRLAAGAAEADQEIRIGELDLALDERPADRRLLRRRRAVAGRPPGHDVGDVDASAGRGRSRRACGREAGPERPTKGRPCMSSSRPGASPTSITRLLGLPSAKTSLGGGQAEIAAVEGGERRRGAPRACARLRRSRAPRGSRRAAWPASLAGAIRTVGGSVAAWQRSRGASTGSGARGARQPSRSTGDLLERDVDAHLGVPGEQIGGVGRGCGRVPAFGRLLPSRLGGVAHHSSVSPEHRCRPPVRFRPAGRQRGGTGDYAWLNAVCTRRIASGDGRKRRDCRRLATGRRSPRRAAPTPPTAALCRRGGLRRLGGATSPASAA